MLKDYFKHLYCKSQIDFFNEVSRALDAQEKMFVVTANPETMVMGEAQPAFDAVLCKEDVVIIPDGIGVVWAAKSLGLESHGRLPGVELAEYLIEYASKTRKSLFLYGAQEESITALVKKIQMDHPDVVIAGYRNGYDYSDDEVFQEILTLQPDIVMVALGIPRQELLIDRWYHRFHKGVFVGVGGTFDVLSGTKRRAPKFFRSLNMEWLYRILREPKRLGRFYRSNIQFLRRVRKMKKMEF